MVKRRYGKASKKFKVGFINYWTPKVKKDIERFRRGKKEINKRS